MSWEEDCKDDVDVADADDADDDDDHHGTWI